MGIALGMWPTSEADVPPKSSTVYAWRIIVKPARTVQLLDCYPILKRLKNGLSHFLHREGH